MSKLDIGFDFFFSIYKLRLNKGFVIEMLNIKSFHFLPFFFFSFYFPIFLYFIFGNIRTIYDSKMKILTKSHILRRFLLFHHFDRIQPTNICWFFFCTVPFNLVRSASATKRLVCLTAGEKAEQLMQIHK